LDHGRDIDGLALKEDRTSDRREGGKQVFFLLCIRLVGRRLGTSGDILVFDLWVGEEWQIYLDSAGVA
jgi:hypothetical protein